MTMKIAAIGALLGLASFPAVVGQPALAPASKAVGAAEAFLATLDQAQRAKTVLPLNEKTRVVWSNLPTGVPMQVGATVRNGLKLGDMSASQQQAALALVASVLSPAGYKKVLDIVNADQSLEQTAGRNSTAERARSLRARRVLRRDPRNARAGRAVDCAVRRPSPGDQRDDCRRRQRADAEPYRRAAGDVSAERRDDPSAGAGERQGVRADERARCHAAEAGPAWLRSAEPRARARRRRQGDSTGRYSRFGAEPETARDAAGARLGVGHDPERRGRRVEDERRTGKPARDLLCVGRFDHQRQRGVLPRAGSDRSHRVCAAGSRGVDHIHTIYRDPTNDYGPRLRAQ